MSRISEKLQTVGHSPGRDAFSKRNFWDEGPLSSSFTQVRCLSTPRAFVTLGSPPIGRYSDTMLFVKRRKETTSTNGLLSAMNVNKKLSDSNSSLEEDDDKRQTGEELLNATSDAPPQTCAVCGKLFKPDDVVVMFESEGFHTGCFCCGQCGGPVDPSKPFLVLEEGSPLCRQCSPLCNACGEKICTNHVAVLNRDFHEDCLKCAQCNKQFVTLSKVYACSGEPCCAKCVTPVFDETWSPHSSPTRMLSERRRGSHVGSPSTSKHGSISTSNSPAHYSLPPIQETLSQPAVDDPSSAKKFHSLLRPSFSAPVLSNRLNQHSHKLSLSSLESVMCDELGLPLFMNFCVEDCSIELVVFWLDVEHFKNFSGDDDDIKLFAHHIMLKYIGYYAELPLGLPKKMEDQIIADLQKTPLSKEIFTEAQQYVFTQMETTLLSRFLQSHDGQNYLKALVTRDIDRRQNREEGPPDGTEVIKASVTSFDRRQANTKYYVYEVTVEMEGTTFMVYRRYSEFHTLHQQLKAAFPQEQFPAMPKKVLFGRSQTRLVAQKRMKDLDSYLQVVLSMPPAVTQSHVLRQFLTQTPSDKEDEMFNNRMKESQAAIY